MALSVVLLTFALPAAAAVCVPAEGTWVASDVACLELQGGQEETSLLQTGPSPERRRERRRERRLDRHHWHAKTAADSSPVPYPDFPMASDYRNPLSQEGHALERQVVNGISPDSVMEWLRDIVLLPRPSSPSRTSLDTGITQMVDTYLKNQFESFGFATCTQEFGFQYDGTRRGWNVIAYIPGESPEEGSVTLGAHYDSRPLRRPQDAPGADDNGSGVAALLASARQIAEAEVRPQLAIYFVAFGAEEVGSFGSNAFVEALLEGGGSLNEECRPPNGFPKDAYHGAITMDMVGWKSPSPNFPNLTMTLETDEWALEVAQEVAQASAEYNGDQLKLTFNNEPFASDHLSFLDNGLEGILVIHGDDESYPFYHSSDDTIEGIDSNLMSVITRAVAGGLLRIAGI